MDDGFRRAPMFYGSFVAVVVVAAGTVLVPDLPLIPVLILSQVLNTVLLLPLLVFMYRLGRDHTVMGEFTTTRRQSVGHLVTIALTAVCVVALLCLTVT